jgi:hypothetical protein
MHPVRTKWMETIYRATHPEIADLWCHRPEPGEVWSVWEPDEEEREALANGGRVILRILTEPLPPVAVGVLSAEDSKPIGPHHYKIIPELEEREGGDDAPSRDF